MIKKILQTLTIAIILISCQTKNGGTEDENGWTEDEKIEFLKTCNKKHKNHEVNILGEGRIKMNETMVKELCDCVLEKSLLKYDRAPRNGELTDSSHPEWDLRWSNEMFRNCVEKACKNLFN